MKPIVRIPLAVLLTSAVVSLGMVGVHASEQCVRFIQKKRHHTAATLAAWAAWDKAHPNWHPRPRPADETLAALDFACSVPLIQQPVEDQLPPIDTAGFDVPLDMLPPPETPVVLAMVSAPPIFDTPTMPMVTPPIESPLYPNLSGFVPPHVAPPGMTPEPSTWMLLATSALAILTVGYRRRAQLTAATAPARRRV